MKLNIVQEQGKVDLMQILDFEIVVLPLAIMVFGLTISVLIILKREEIEKRQRARRIGVYLKEKAKQRDLLEKELASLDKLFHERSIDKDTHERLATLIRMSKEKTEETVEILNCPEAEE